MWLSILILLATVAFTVASTGLAILLAAQHKPQLAGALGLLSAGWIALYIAALAITGFISHDTMLAVGQEKHICEMDCHLAYAVIDANSRGSDYVITMRMRFDETTIGPNRGNGPVNAGPRRILLLDDHDVAHEPLRANGFDTALHPGEATEATLVFRLPANVRPVRLRFEDADPVKRILIGSETAFLHRHVDFALGRRTGI